MRIEKIKSNESKEKYAELINMFSCHYNAYTYYPESLQCEGRPSEPPTPWGLGSTSDNLFDADTNNNNNNRLFTILRK